MSSNDVPTASVVGDYTPVRCATGFHVDPITGFCDTVRYVRDRSHDHGEVRMEQEVDEE